LIEGSIALHPPSVESDFTHLSHTALATHLEDLDEEVLEVLAVIHAKGADRAEIRLLIRGKIPEGDVAFK